MYPIRGQGAEMGRPPYGGAEVWTIDLEGGGAGEAVFIPAGGDGRSPAVVFFHGNAETVDDQAWIVERYRRLGWAILLPEYRGYGRADGHPSEQGLVADAVAFYDRLAARADVDARRIVFHGRSLGGGVAVQVADRRRPAAMILQSTFSSMAAMSYRYGVPQFVCREPYRSDAVLPRLEVPVFIAHGTEDGIIPVDHGRRLNELARDSTFVTFECGHNDFPGVANDERYWEAIVEFLGQAGLLSNDS